MNHDYSSMPPRSVAASAPSTLACLADAAGYRYFWATADLPESALAFTPPGGGMTLGELLGHLRDLSWKVHEAVTGISGDRSATTVAAMRESTLTWIGGISEGLLNMSATELEAIEVVAGAGYRGNLKTLIHGPIADFLTHVGQVNSWRRMAGNPPHKPRVFHGLPPE